MLLYMFYRYYILKKRYSKIREEDRLKTEVFNQINMYVFIFILSLLSCNLVCITRVGVWIDF